MSTATKPDRALPITSADVSDEEITKMKAAMRGLKLRKGYKQIIETGDPEATEYKLYSVPTVEVWHRERRCYLPLGFSKGWHFTTPEERDIAIGRLSTK